MAQFWSSVLQLAFLYALAAWAVAVAFRVIGFPDLTPDGSFTLGAAVTAVLILKNWPPTAAGTVAVLVGALSGVVTAVLHTRLGISRLLSGILVMLMLYSASLRIMHSPNLSLLHLDNMMLRSVACAKSVLWPIGATLAVAAVTYAVLLLLLRTRAGMTLRAAGDSDTALEIRGIRRSTCYLVGLACSNGLAALGGSLIAQYQGFVDVTMGTGLVVTTLAAVVMGEAIIRPQSVSSLMVAPVIGMVLYQSVVAVALKLGLTPADLKLSTAVIALAVIVVERQRVKRGASDRQIGNRAF